MYLNALVVASQKIDFTTLNFETSQQMRLILGLWIDGKKHFQKTISWSVNLGSWRGKTDPVSDNGAECN